MQTKLHLFTHTLWIQYNRLIPLESKGDNNEVLQPSCSTQKKREGKTARTGLNFTKTIHWNTETNKI